MNRSTSYVPSQVETMNCLSPFWNCTVWNTGYLVFTTSVFKMFSKPQDDFSLTFFALFFRVKEFFQWAGCPPTPSPSCSPVDKDGRLDSAPPTLYKSYIVTVESKLNEFKSKHHVSSHTYIIHICISACFCNSTREFRIHFILAGAKMWISVRPALVIFHHWGRLTLADTVYAVKRHISLSHQDTIQHVQLKWFVCNLVFGFISVLRTTELRLSHDSENTKPTLLPYI